jgi:hypothetical protein
MSTLNAKVFFLAPLLRSHWCDSCCSVRELLGKSLEELLPLSCRPVTKLWASHCWEILCWASFLLGERVAHEVVTGRATSYVESLSDKSLGESLLGDSLLGELLGR